jgi:hypothetical protein
VAPRRLAKGRLSSPIGTETSLCHRAGDRGNPRADRVRGHALLARALLARALLADRGVAASADRRERLLSEQFLALDHDPYGEHAKRDGAQPDRHVHQQQLAGDDPVDENPDGDGDKHGAEPDHL